MTLTACSLEPDELHEQLERYRAIGRRAAAVEHEPGFVVVRFDDDPPSVLIERTLEVERGCCSFFEIDYKPGTQRLVISVDQPDRRPSLDSIAHALMESRATGPVADSGTAEVRTVPDVTSCCSPNALEMCCEPRDKPECCGPPPSGGRTDAAPSRSA
jgi:hypothetical protein